MTAHTPLTTEQLADIEAAIAAYQRHAPTGFACCTAHPVADAGAGLLAEVRRLQAELASVTALCDEQDMAARMFELPQPAWIRAVRAAINAEESHDPASAAGESGSTR
jgi:hypothetical protein